MRSRLNVFTVRRLATGLAGCALLCLVQLWPIASSPAHQSFGYNDDALEITWIVNWVAHQLPRDPVHILDANIFYPSRRSLATCEPLLVPGLLAVPVYAASANPVLTHNVTWLAGFLLSTFTMYCLVLYLTGDVAAALVAATLFMFNSHIATRYPHLMAVHMEWLPAALLMLERFLDQHRGRQALWLGGFVALGALTSGHLAVYTLVSVGLVFLARARDWWPARIATIRWLAAGAALAVAVALPVLLPWLGPSLHREQGGVATVGSYLASVAWIHRGWSGALFASNPSAAFFPGFMALSLVVAALVIGLAAGGVMRRRTMAYGVVGVAGAVLSFGHATPALGLLEMLMPPAGSIRAVSRFGYLFLLAVAILAGLGFAALRKRCPRKVGTTLAAVVVLVVVNVEAFAPPHTVPYGSVVPIYQHLARRSGRTVLLELPYYHRPAQRHRNAQYMFNSTVHWKPLVNGYGSYYPREHQEFGQALSHFPAPRSLRVLRKLRVTHLMIHSSRYDADTLAAVLAFLDSHPGFRLVAQDSGGRRLYRVFNRRHSPAPAEARRTAGQKGPARGQ